MDKEKIIFGVLNWGLGHATRSIPLIRRFREAGFEPVLASDGAALALLKTEFPDLIAHELPSYDIHYSARHGAFIAVALQSLKIWRAMRAEKRVLRQLVQSYTPAGVVSDNRPGFYHSALPSVYVSHQLKLMLPFARSLISRWHHRFIGHFDECWIPDFSGSRNLGGEMTHGLLPSVRLKYLGPLSRFKELGRPQMEHAYEVCVILSGPEPQRGLLEEKLYHQLQHLPGQHLFIRGVANPGKPLAKKSNIHLRNFINGEELAQLIASSRICISRSGYSSVMDYFYLGNQALLIPTPAQPEQEYLARYLMDRGYFSYVAQSEINLSRDVERALKFPGLLPERFDETLSGDRDLFHLFKGKRKGRS